MEREERAGIGVGPPTAALHRRLRHPCPASPHPAARAAGRASQGRSPAMVCGPPPMPLEKEGRSTGKADNTTRFPGIEVRFDLTDAERAKMDTNRAGRPSGANASGGDDPDAEGVRTMPICGVSPL